MLRVVKDYQVGGNRICPNIDYPLLSSELVHNYEELKIHFVNGSEEATGWRHAIKSLFHFIRVFRFLDDNVLEVNSPR